MDGLVPKDRPNLDSRELTPAETEKHSVSDQGEHRAQELGDLYFAADNYAVALEYYRRALDAEARKNGSVDRDALFRLGARIVDCLRYRGDLDEAVDALHDLHHRLRPHVTPEQTGRLAGSLGILLFDRARYRAAQRASVLAYRLLRETTLNFDIGRAEMTLGWIALRTGSWASSRDYFESAIATYRRADFKAGMASAYNSLALVHKNQCRFKEAARFLEQALRIAERAGLYQDSGTYLHNLGIVHEKMGEWDLAEEHYRRALQIYTETGYAPGKARALNCLGILRRKRRDYSSAENLIREALALATERSCHREVVLAKEALGDWLADLGRLDEARAEYDTALVLADQLATDSDLQAELWRRIGDAQLRMGELDHARRSGERSLAIARRLGDKIEEACSLRLLGLRAAEAGEWDEARPLIEEASRILGGIAKRYELAKLNLAVGIVWRKRGRKGRSRIVLDESVAFLRRAVAGFESLALPVHTARALLELARSELNRGLMDEAVIHLDHATSLNSPDDDPLLSREIDEFRSEVEKGLIEGTSSQSNEFAAFDEIRSALRGADAETALQEILSIVVRRTGATRALVAAPAAQGGIEAVATIGMAHRLAQDLIRELERRIGPARLASAPVVTSRAGADDRFKDLPAAFHVGPRTTLAVMPLSLPSGLPGYLYVDRPEEGPLGAFKQREINLIAVLANHVAVAILELQRQRLAHENSALRGRLLGTANDHGIVTRSPELLEILSLLERVGPTDATILVEGETGSGKGLLARAIHASSSRTNKPLIQVNCAALPEQLLESELFGHVQGAFTGAVRDKAGLFVEANGGTLFLDEVDKTTITTQGKLLQVLDNREVRPVGGNRTTKVDVRVLCATNVNLRARIARGEFLEDLYYRLNDICFRVPPLRERPEDVPLLIDHYVSRYSGEMGKQVGGVDPELIRTFSGLPWRGNVRELEKVVKRMVVMANEGETLSVRLVPKDILRKEEDATDAPATLRSEVAKVERRMIQQALERHSWNKLQAARELSLSYPTLLQKIKLFHLDRRGTSRQRA
ncbi:MAG TPA: sigma 54-interacting transcriptional regulator [Candidatus Eisenbacteria bacterium]|nr:sigma 54-interacting transcriptional regulator [Candidatus Eisenbacteria bacterium]